MSNKKFNRHNKNRGHFNKNKNLNKQDKQNVNSEVKENVKEVIKEDKYTRNLDPLEVGFRLAPMTLFDHNEDEFNLSDDKNIKLYVSIPTFSNKGHVNELVKMETILKEYPSLNAYIISNEPVYTQTRLSKNYKFEKFRILSDFKNREFARNTGTYIYELSLLVKALFVVDKTGRILFVKYYDDLLTSIDLNELNNILKNVFS